MKKIIFTIVGMFIIGAYSCNNKEYDIIDNQETETTISTRAQMYDDSIIKMCKKLLSSQEFAEFKNLLANVGMKLYIENGNRLDKNINNMDELMAWVKQNIEDTGYKNIAEFEKDIAKIQSIAKSIQIQYADILLNEHNFQLLQDLAIHELPTTPDIIPQGEDCIGNLLYCLRTAEKTLKDRLGLATLLFLKNPFMAYIAVIYAYADFHSDKRACEAAAYACVGIQPL